MSFRRQVLLLLISAICGSLSGAAAGFFASGMTADFDASPQPVVSRPSNATSTSDLTIVPIEHRSVVSLLPEAFEQRTRSSVASLYRKHAADLPLEDRMLGSDRLLGQAVALTSDGWFIGMASSVAALRTTDVAVWYEGRSYPLERGVIDRLNDTVYLKIASNEVASVAFSDVEDLVQAGEVWSEPRAGQLAPQSILSLSSYVAPNEAHSSEQPARRILLAGFTESGDRGGAVWDTNGDLVGLIESGAGERVRVLPSVSIRTSFESLLTRGEIVHAGLGVRAVDVKTLRVDGSRDPLPTNGAWIHVEKKSAKPAIAKDSAASKARLAVGDVILKVERDILDGTSDLGEILSEYKPGSSVKLRVLRGTTDLDIPVTLSSLTTSELMR